MYEQPFEAFVSKPSTLEPDAYGFMYNIFTTHNLLMQGNAMQHCLFFHSSLLDYALIYDHNDNLI